MSDAQPDFDLKAIGARVRQTRENLGLSSLEVFADRIGERGCERPSIAKLSRIETGIQPVTTDILTELSDVTGIPADELRPDLAVKFRKRESAQ